MEGSLRNGLRRGNTPGGVHDSGARELRAVLLQVPRQLPLDFKRGGDVQLEVVGAVTRSRTIGTGAADRAANMVLFARQPLCLFDEVLHADTLPPPSERP